MIIIQPTWLVSFDTFVNNLLFPDRSPYPCGSFERAARPAILPGTSQPLDSSPYGQAALGVIAFSTCMELTDSPVIIGLPKKSGPQWRRCRARNCGLPLKPKSSAPNAA